MTNMSRSRTAVLIAGCIIITLAGALFMNAMTIADFAPSGGGIFHGRSGPRLVLAFALLAGQAIALLAIVFRAGRPREDVPVRNAAGGANAAETNAFVQTETPAGIISETAGELRTAVDVIQDELDEILDDEAPMDREHMHALYEETDRLKKIIDSMEQLSRVEAIARRGRKEPLLIEPLLAGLIEAARQAAPGRDVTYTLECEPGCSLKADPECLGTIIGNLMDNAARSIKGSGSVTVTAGRKGAMAVFSVTDTGSGIRRAQLPHIYERFFRGTGSGIGMGLSIAKELVDACGGTIEVRTELNKGTTFTVQLPAE
jgi:signal transduction histidine kinase